MSADGKWTVSWSTGRGSRAATVQLAVEGSSLSGSFATGLGDNDAKPISGGSIDGDNLRWQATTEDYQGPLVLTFQAKLDGDRMQGTIETPQGSNPFTGIRA